MSLDYKAYLVDENNKIQYISPVHTRGTAKALVDYWKGGNVGKNFQKSFSSREVPATYKKQVEAYWDEYRHTHPVKEVTVDANELPW